MSRQANLNRYALRGDKDGDIHIDCRDCGQTVDVTYSSISLAAFMRRVATHERHNHAATEGTKPTS